jgi:hypothetical protein
MAVSIFKAKRRSHRDVWAEFFANSKRLARHHVTAEELQILRDFAPRGVVTCIGDVLFILGTIRWANREKAP